MDDTFGNSTEIARRKASEKRSCMRVSVCVLEDMEDESTTKRDLDTEAWTHSEPRQ